MRDAEAFSQTAFLGRARTGKQDPYRLELLARHLEADERPIVVLPVQGGTLVVTDQRLLELRAHLEVHGAWNVKEFQGHSIYWAFDRADIQTVDHVAQAATDRDGNRRVDDRLVLGMADGPREVLVSRGPESALSEADFAGLRDAILGRQPK